MLINAFSGKNFLVTADWIIFWDLEE